MPDGNRIRPDMKAFRAGFVARGTSFAAFCAAQGLKRQNVAKAIEGRWTGPRAAEVLDLLRREAGISE